MGAIRLIICEVHTYAYVTCIDFTMTACGSVETCLKDVSYHSTLDIAGSWGKFWRLANEEALFLGFFPCGNSNLGALERC